MTILRLPLLAVLLPVILSSCSRRAEVEHEAVVRTRMEAFEDQWDQGAFRFDAANGQRAFQINCAGCHGAQGNLAKITSGNQQTLGRSASMDMRRFWNIANFGEEGTHMKGHFDDIPFQDLVDLTGYSRTLPKQ